MILNEKLYNYIVIFRVEWVEFHGMKYKENYLQTSFESLK